MKLVVKEEPKKGLGLKLDLGLPILPKKEKKQRNLYNHQMYLLKRVLR